MHQTLNTGRIRHRCHGLLAPESVPNPNKAPQMRGPYNEALGPETAGRLVMHRNYAPFKCPNFRLFIGKGPQTKIDLAYSGKLKQFPKKMKLYNDSSSKASCFFSGPFAVHSPPKRKGQNFIQRIAAPKNPAFSFNHFNPALPSCW